MKPAVIAFAIILLAGCDLQEPVHTTFDPAYPDRNSAGDPIVAVFAGRIPCAGQACEMRKVELVLYGREQGTVATTYWLGQIGVGLSDDRVVGVGTWSGRRGVRNYPDALVYALEEPADPSLRYLWRVNDEILLVLDESMKPKAGNGAWGNMLSRNCAPYGPRTYPYDARARRFIAVASPEASCSG